MSLKIKFESKPPLIENLKGGFDNPKNGTRISQDKLFISGWFYLPGNNISVVVRVKLSDGFVFENEHFLDVHRPDVNDHLSLQSPDLRLGFQFSVSMLNAVDVKTFLKTDSVFYHVWSCENCELPNDIPSNIFEIAWQKIHKFEYIGKQKFDSSFFEKLINKIDFYDALDFEEFFVLKYSSHVVVFDKFIAQFQRADWAKETIMQLNGGDCLDVDGFIAGETFSCRASFIVDDMNFLFFSNDKECFYLIQHSTNIALFFPIYFASITLSVQPWVIEANKKLPRIFNYLINMGEQWSGREKVSAKFNGLLLANIRPYHFFYDYMNGLNLLIEAANRPFNIYSVHGMDFFPADLAFPDCTYAGKSEQTINDELTRSFGFLLMPCVPYFSKKFGRDLKSLSSKLIQIESSAKSIDFQNNLFDLIVWIGISTEKRSWLEQINGFTHILKELSADYKNILVLVDGRTFPLNPREVDINCKRTEDSVYDALVVENSGVQFFNMVGLQSSQKIILASKIDFFISSYLTDSMYPSAICEKPGVVYIPPSVTPDQKLLHIHHNIIEIPSDKVKEVTSSTGVYQSWHEISVSMDWKDVYQCVLQLIEKFNIRK